MSEEAICICEKHDFYDFFPNNEKTKCPCCEVEHLTEQLNSKQDALSAALLALDNAVERCVGLEAEFDRYKSGVEMEGYVVGVPSDIDANLYFASGWSRELGKLRGKVRVLVMKVEEET